MVSAICGLDAAPHGTTLYLHFANLDSEKVKRLNEVLVNQFCGYN
ncbi:MAG: hypothetical protein U9R10_01815 [Euryarchaeota archaeon]|nr:hypothetical protein [Euryarchaeota archaeon]